MSNTFLVLTALGAASCLSAQTKLAGGAFVVTAGLFGHDHNYQSPGGGR
jgi:hypothetical protein